jgi:hypothetical protein
MAFLIQRERPMRTTWVLVAVLIGFGSLLVSCGGSRRTTTAVVVTSTSARPSVKHGPPPHTPAHGYRHKHGGCEMVYDSGLELYVVVGVSGRYFSDGRFYRQRGRAWFMSTDVDGPWKAAQKSALPHGLTAAKKGKGKNATVNK